MPSAYSCARGNSSTRNGKPKRPCKHCGKPHPIARKLFGFVLGLTGVLLALLARFSGLL